MSTLHTRGYRPNPGERGRGCPVMTRRVWRMYWSGVRLGTSATLSALMRGLARECMDARERFSQRHVGALTHVDIDQRINARGWDTWDTPVSVEPRPRWAIGLGVPR